MKAEIVRKGVNRTLKLRDDDDELRGWFYVRGINRLDGHRVRGQDMYKIVGTDGDTLGHLWLNPEEVSETWER